MMTQSLNANDPKYYDPNNPNYNNYQLPVRVVMNNLTFSVFTSDDYASNIISFDLQTSSFRLSKEHKDCFIISDKYPIGNPKRAEFCPFGTEKASAVNHEWNYDFNLFQTQCQTKRDSISTDSFSSEELKDKLKDKIVILFIK
jgi:hypothetical protein